MTYEVAAKKSCSKSGLAIVNVVQQSLSSYLIADFDIFQCEGLRSAKGSTQCRLRESQST